MCDYWGEIMSTNTVIAIGTAVLAIVALFQHHIKSFLTTPSLFSSTTTTSPFCKKLLFVNPQYADVTADGYALRIAVKNTTTCFRIKSRAEEAEVFLSMLERKESDREFHPILGFDPSNLIWSHSFNPFTAISPDMERYCFVGRVIKPSMRQEFPDFDNSRLPRDKTCLRLDVATARHTKEHIIPPGKYRLTCLIGCANTKSIKKIFEVSISGEWFDDEVEMYERGLDIKML